jgi:hypothetical protein
MDKVTINGQELNVRFGFRTFMLFEEVTDGKTINNIRGLKDMLTLYHCALIASNEDYHQTFDEFIDAVEKEENNLAVPTLTVIYNRCITVKKNNPQRQPAQKKKTHGARV